MNIQFRAMVREPQWREVGRNCNVRASYSRAMRALEDELRRINATDAVIEAGFDPCDIRQDGMPRASARPKCATVRITFTKGKLPLSFVCGGHADWVQNVYLIAKTLECLRAVDRYGCNQAAEQYTGWAALPAGRGAIEAGEWASRFEAARFIVEVAKEGRMDPKRDQVSVTACMNSEASLRDWYRLAAGVAHPDQGGNTDLMAKVNRAREFLERGVKP